MNNKVRVLTKNGKWLYGVYPYLGPNMENNLSPMSQFWQWIDDPHNQVRRETISWAIGLHDLKDKKIYSGDIVKAYISKFVNINMTVTWNIQNACFELVATHEKGGFWTLCGTEIEVIGNIWQNPELLEVK